MLIEKHFKRVKSFDFFPFISKFSEKTPKNMDFRLNNNTG